MAQTTNSQLEWATTEDYQKAFAYLEKRGQQENQYAYISLLESVGLAVYRKDLRDWLNYTLDSNNVSVSEFKKFYEA